MGIVENTVRVAGAFSNSQTTNVYVMHKHHHGIVRLNTSVMIDLCKSEYCASCHVTLNEGSYTLVSRDSDGSVYTSQYYTDRQYWDEDEPIHKTVNSPIHDSPCTICVPIPRKAVPVKALPLVFR